MKDEFNINLKLSAWDIVDNIMENLQNEEMLGRHAFPEVGHNYTPSIRVPLKHSLLELVNKCLTYEAEQMDLDTSKIYMKKGKKYICITDNKLSSDHRLKYIYINQDTEDMQITITNEDHR